MRKSEQDNIRATRVAERVAYWMPILEAVFCKRPSQERHDAFYTALVDLQPGAVHQAFVRVIRERKTFPAPAVVRELALEEQSLVTKPRQRELFLAVDNTDRRNTSR